MKQTFLGVIEQGESSFGIYFPDFPGCVSAGESLQDVIAMGSEALQFHVEAMVDDGDAIPVPTAVDLDAERHSVPDAKLVSLAAITVDIPETPGLVRVVLAKSALKQIDALRTSRSAFIKRAVRNELARVKSSA